MDTSRIHHSYAGPVINHVLLVHPWIHVLPALLVKIPQLMRLQGCVNAQLVDTLILPLINVKPATILATPARLQFRIALAAQQLVSSPGTLVLASLAIMMINPQQLAKHALTSAKPVTWLVASPAPKPNIGSYQELIAFASKATTMMDQANYVWPVMHPV